MKLYYTERGQLIGVYREGGSPVMCVTYRDVYVTKRVEHERIVTHPDIVIWKRGLRRIPEHWVEIPVEVPGHYEIQKIWVPEYKVTRLREIPGYYELRKREIPAWIEYVEVLVPENVARKIPAHTEIQEILHPAIYEHYKFYVDATYEQYTETIPAGYKDQRVWVPTMIKYESKLMPSYFAEQSYQVIEKVPDTIEKYYTYEEVLAVHEPIFAYWDPAQIPEFEIISYVPISKAHPGDWDYMKYKQTSTGAIVEVNVEYMGMAVRIGDNEFVLQ